MLPPVEPPPPCELASAIAEALIAAAVVCQAVAAAETRHAPADTDRRPSDLPGDGVVLTGRVVAAAANGWLDERRATLEVLTAIKRAGADLILSYHAKEVSQWLRDAE